MRQPKSIKSCREEIRSLQDEVKSIEEQLADRGKRMKGSDRKMTFSQHQAWKKNAMRAMRMKLAQLADLKKWVREEHARIIAGALDVIPDDPDSLLQACFAAHEKVKGDVGIDNLDPDVIAVFDLVRDRVLGLA